MNRDDLIALFLARNGFPPDHLEPLAQDASLRRYLRIRGDRPAVLMDAPPPENVRPFLRIAAHLRSIGLRVPRTLAADEACGLVLEEDLGDDLVSVLLDQGEPVDRLLDAAVDALVVMQRAALPDGLPLWDSPAMASTASGTLFDWWWPARFGAPPPQAARDDVAHALATTLAPVAAGPSCFVHRDFFAGNLLRLSDQRLAIIDFQGAAIGHPAYDLVSLLQDARRDIPDASRSRALDRYLTARPELELDAIPSRIRGLRRATPSSGRRPVGKACFARRPAAIHCPRAPDLAAAAGRLVPTRGRTAGRRLRSLDPSSGSRQPART